MDIRVILFASTIYENFLIQMYILIVICSFIIEENINNNTGISFFAIFDGHGGEFAADFAKEILVGNIYNKVIETTRLLNLEKQQDTKSQSAANAGANDDYGEFDESPYLKRRQAAGSRKDETNKENSEPGVGVNRRDSLRKTHR